MARCRSCDAVIRWGVTEAGKRIPLNATPTTTFRLEGEGDAPRAVSQQGYVAHFATCPMADAHRKPRGKDHQP